MTNTAITDIADAINMIRDIDPGAIIDIDLPLSSLLASFDICPIHLTDFDTCADDELTDCAHLR